MIKKNTSKTVPRTFDSPDMAAIQLSMFPRGELWKTPVFFEPDLPPKPPDSPVSIIADDSQKMPEAVDHPQSESTRRNYGRAWDAFERWCGDRRLTALPANTETVRVYFTQCSADGLKIATIRAARAAIRDRHLRFYGSDPTATPKVKKVLSRLAKQDTRPQGHARPLTAEDMDKIRAKACIPRKTSGASPRQESHEAAERRGRLDIAMLMLLRDSLLGVSALVDLRWGDIEYLPDGSGRINLRGGQTDRDGMDLVPPISPATVQDLEYIRPDGVTVHSDDRMIGLSSCQIGRRVGKAAQIAGLGGGYSGHSGRIGMVQELAASGTDEEALMDSGGWKSKKMPDLYIGSRATDQGVGPGDTNGQVEVAPGRRTPA